MQAIERLLKNKEKSAWALPAMRLVSLTMSSWFARLSPLTLDPLGVLEGGSSSRVAWIQVVYRDH